MEHQFQVGDEGLTRDGRTFRVTKRNEFGTLQVVVDGKLETAHCYYNGRCLADPRERHCGDLMPPNICATTLSNQETPMQLKIEDRIYINGCNAADLSDEDLINKISEAENEMTRLMAITTKSSKIVEQIDNLARNARRLAGVLDSR